MAVITISREVGSGGDQIAHQVCKLLEYRYFDKMLIAQVAREQGISETEVVDFSEDKYRVRGFIDALLGRSARVAIATTVATTTSGAETRFVHPVADGPGDGSRSHRRYGAAVGGASVRPATAPGLLGRRMRLRGEITPATFRPEPEQPPGGLS